MGLVSRPQDSLHRGPRPFGKYQAPQPSQAPSPRKQTQEKEQGPGPHLSWGQRVSCLWYCPESWPCTHCSMENVFLLIINILATTVSVWKSHVQFIVPPRHSLSESAVPIGCWGWWWGAYSSWPLHRDGWDLCEGWRGFWVEGKRQVLLDGHVINIACTHSCESTDWMDRQCPWSHLYWWEMQHLMFVFPLH